jgi:transposase
VRFLDAFVDGLDLAAAGFVGVCAKPTGRPGYAQADLLKLYIYGYLNRIRSSRRLEAETHRNIEVIWLLRHLKPDFKTIADFRRDNRAAFKPIFREFVLLCRQLDLFGREPLAVDGTRLKAVNKDRNFTRSVSARRGPPGREPLVPLKRWLSRRERCGHGWRGGDHHWPGAAAALEH